MIVLLGLKYEVTSREVGVAAIVYAKVECLQKFCQQKDQ